MNHLQRSFGAGHAPVPEGPAGGCCLCNPSVCKPAVWGLLDEVGPVVEWNPGNQEPQGVGVGTITDQIHLNLIKESIQEGPAFVCLPCFTVPLHHMSVSQDACDLLTWWVVPPAAPYASSPAAPPAPHCWRRPPPPRRPRGQALEGWQHPVFRQGGEDMSYTGIGDRMA